MLSWARVILIVMTIMALPGTGITYLQTASWYAMLVMIATGFTQGLLCSWVMIKGCSSSQNNEIAGYIMAFFLTVGLALGSVLGYLEAKIFL